MNYMTFCETLKQELSASLGKEASVTVQKIHKNNGILQDAFCLSRPGVSCSPAIYLLPLYEAFLNGDSLPNLSAGILSFLERQPPLSETVLSDLRDFNTAKDRIAFRLISREYNEELLTTVPWLPFLDLAIVFILCISQEKDGRLTALIHNSQMALWGLSPKELYKIAARNTPRLFPPVLKRLEHVLNEMLQDEDGSGPFGIPGFLPLNPPLYLLTNQDSCDGAACLLYENVIKDLADQYQKDLLILPSSVHEVLLSPDIHKFSYPMLQDLIQKINREELSPEDRLSDRLYLYERETGTFKLCIRSGGFHDMPAPDGKSNP